MVKSIMFELWPWICNYFYNVLPLTYRYGAGCGVCGAPADSTVGPGRPQYGWRPDIPPRHDGEPLVSSDPQSTGVTAGTKTGMLNLRSIRKKGEGGVTSYGVVCYLMLKLPVFFYIEWFQVIVVVTSKCLWYNI